MARGAPLHLRVHRRHRRAGAGAGHGGRARTGPAGRRPRLGARRAAAALGADQCGRRPAVGISLQRHLRRTDLVLRAVARPPAGHSRAARLRHGRHGGGRCMENHALRRHCRPRRADADSRRRLRGSRDRRGQCLDHVLEGDAAAAAPDHGHRRALPHPAGLRHLRPALRADPGRPRHRHPVAGDPGLQDALPESRNRPGRGGGDHHRGHRDRLLSALPAALQGPGRRRGRG